MTTRYYIGRPDNPRLAPLHAQTNALFLHRIIANDHRLSEADPKQWLDIALQACRHEQPDDHRPAMVMDMDRYHHLKRCEELCQQHRLI